MQVRLSFIYNQQHAKQLSDALQVQKNLAVRKRTRLQEAQSTVDQKQAEMDEVNFKLAAVNHYLGFNISLPKNPKVSFTNWDEWCGTLEYLSQHNQKGFLEERKKEYESQLGSKQFYFESDVGIKKRYEEEVEKIEKEILDLQSELDKVNQFLQTLVDNPQVLVDEKHQYLTTAFANYTQFNPIQSETTRLILTSIQEKLDAIKNTNENINSVGKKEFFTDAKTTPQQNQALFKYALFTGFIADLIMQVREKKEEKEEDDFLPFLKDLLKEMHIAENGDLPEPRKLQMSCEELFLLFADLHPELYKVRVETLSHLEDEYKKEKDIFTNLFSLHPELNKVGKELYHSIIKDLKNKNKMELAKLYPSYARIFREGAIILDPIKKLEEKQIAIKNLLEIAENLPTTSSAKLKVAGALVAFIGLAVAVTSVLLFPPLAPFGALLGATLLVKGLLIAGAVTGVALTGIGATLFYFGCDRGVHAKTVNYAEKSRNKITIM